MLTGNLYLIRTILIKDEEQEREMIKSLEMILPEEIRTRVATIEIKDQEVFVPFLSENEVTQLINTFKVLGILLHVQNITEQVLRNEIIVPELVDLFLEPEFDLLRKEYISENLTVDMILDKISRSGINSLTELDRKVLAVS